MIDFEDPPEEEVEEQGVEVDAADDGSCELGQLAPQLGVIRVPKSMIYAYIQSPDKVYLYKNPKHPPVCDYENEEETGQGANQASHRTAEREAAVNFVNCRQKRHQRSLIVVLGHVYSVKLGPAENTTKYCSLYFLISSNPLI